MTELAGALKVPLDLHLQAVRNTLQTDGMDSREIDELLENLHLHAFETANRYLQSNSVAVAVERTMAELAPPHSYRENYLGEPKQSSRHVAIAPTTVIGILSAVIMLSAFAASIVFAENKLFDTQLSGTFFVFGELFALSLGLASLSNIWGKVGAICSGTLLAFLSVAFLWQSLFAT